MSGAALAHTLTGGYDAGANAAWVVFPAPDPPRLTTRDEQAHLRARVAELSRENRLLRRRVDELEAELSFELDLSEEAECAVLEVREGVSREVAMGEVERYVLAHPGTDAYDICIGLRLPFPLVESILDALVDEGVLRSGGENQG